MRYPKTVSKLEVCTVFFLVCFALALSLPALGRGRSHSQQMVCMSHLFQWGEIMSRYTMEHDGWFPPADIGSPNVRGAWMEVLYDWWNEQEVLLKCPSALVPGDEWGGPATAYVNWNLPHIAYEHGSYGLNLWVLNETRTVQYRRPENHWRRADSITEPESVPMFLDSMWRGGGPSWDNDNAIARPEYNGQWIDYPFEMMHFAIDRHAGGVNSLFVDNSVRKVSVKALWTLRWHKYYDTERAMDMLPSWWGPWLGNIDD